MIALISLQTLGVILIIVGLVGVGVDVGLGMFSIMPAEVTVNVVDVDSGEGILGADVSVYFNYYQEVTGTFHTAPVYSVTDELGLVVVSVPDWAVYPSNVRITVDAEGFRSDFENYGKSYYYVAHSLDSSATVVVELVSGEPVTVVASGDLSVEVVDVDSGLGVLGASVYVFEGGDYLSAYPNSADYSGVTNADGACVFYGLSGLHVVGVKVEDYVSDSHLPVVVNEGSSNEFEYSSLSVISVLRDENLVFELWDTTSTGEDWIPDFNVSKGGFSLLMVISLIIACCGVGLLGYGKFRE